MSGSVRTSAHHVACNDRAVDIREVGETTFGWGESVVWDDRRDRLYLVDCLAGTLHWLDGGEGEVHALRTPSMPTGVVPTDDGRLLVVLDDGLHVVDPDSGAVDLVARSPRSSAAGPTTPAPTSPAT
jgi:sugar lactone lactonase YvrE